jgi:CRP-like cAMP-binding protein
MELTSDPNHQMHAVRNTFCFSDTSFAALQEIMYQSTVAADSHVFWEGDADDKLYYVFQGQVKLVKHNMEGKEYVFSQYQKGDILGQFDPYIHSVHSSSAKTVVDSVLGIIQKKDLEVLLWQNGDLAIEFMLAHRLTQTKLRDLMLYGKQGALCSTLIRLANTFGRQTKQGIVICEKVTNTELADYIGAARESVNRMLGELRKQNAITLENGHIVITDLAHLQMICHCEKCPKEICRI